MSAETLEENKKSELGDYLVMHQNPVPSTNTVMENMSRKFRPIEPFLLKANSPRTLRTAA